MTRSLTLFLALAIPCPLAGAQSLLDRPAAPAPAPAQPGAPAANGGAPATNGSAAADPGAPLRGVSLFLVTPPAPRTYQKNDLVAIIINETSLQKHEQKLDATKDYSLQAAANAFPSLRDFLEFQLRNGDSHAPAKADVNAKKDFQGDGKYERKDTFTARITATVLEVKPNGTLVLEAQKSVKSNNEETTLVLSGLCRPDDITQSNTVQSGQLANLVLRVHNDGDVKNAANKGIIARALDTIFNF